MIETFKKNELQNTLDTTHRIGAQALLEAAEVPTLDSPKLQEFEHLFPLSNNDPNHPVTAEDLLDIGNNIEKATQLALSLDKNDPYRDYVLSYIAQHHIDHGDLDHAYDIINRLGDNAFMVHALSELIIYLDNHNLEPIKPDLDTKLHDTAIGIYDSHPSAETARALAEASIALPDDTEIGLYAQIAIAEHPEIEIHLPIS